MGWRLGDAPGMSMFVSRAAQTDESSFVRCWRQDVAPGGTGNATVTRQVHGGAGSAAGAAACSSSRTLELADGWDFADGVFFT